MKKKNKRCTLIIESQNRCKKMGLNPEQKHLTNSLSRLELMEKQKYNERLINAALPYMNLCSKTFQSCGSILVLTDREGFILKAIGPRAVLKSRAKIGLKEGSSLSEKDAGTNAVALCIRYKEPFFVSGKEYYLRIFQDGVCFAAPIFYNDAILGTIVIVHPRKNGHAHSFALIQTISRLIEQEYRNLLEKDFVVEICDALNATAIMTDLNGEIRYFNARARDLLKIEKCRNIRSYFDEDILQKEEIINKVLYSRCLDKSFIVVRKSYNNNFLFLFEPVQEGLEHYEKIRSTMAQFTFEDIIGLKEIKKEAKRLAYGESNILIIGESGTGKELLASAIHNASKRSMNRFVAVNCNAIPASLFEAELFGYKKGAFTDARTDREGKIEFADKGTLFLDEIGDLPLDVQGKLLRVLENGIVCRLGSNEQKKVNVRFIFATNKDLEEMVKNKRFREDLYYRIYAPVIKIPPLQERKDEIPELVRHIFLKLKNEHKTFVEGISEEAMDALMNYDFPGNVRELEGILRQAILFTKRSEIGVEDLGLLKHTALLSIEERVKRYKAKLIYESFVLNNRDIKKTCKSLKISRAQLYRYIKIINRSAEK
ncbi:MAG: sigma-54-dependent Fis family transcriptional regulator [bacterium]